MSSQSVNTKSKGLSVNQLIQKNADALETRQLIPYQQTVYAIPEEWRKKEEQLLAEAVQFQPKLYRLIEDLATREEWDNLLRQQRSLLYQQSNALGDRVERILQQDGKTREEFSSELSRQLSNSIWKLENAKKDLEQTCRKWVLITAAVSTVSSTLVCVLCLLLAG